MIWSMLKSFWRGGFAIQSLAQTRSRSSCHFKAQAHVQLAGAVTSKQPDARIARGK
jgi:hypothetical protein